DVAAISPTEQYAWLSEPITITLPCDANIVACHRFEVNLGNSAPAAVEIDKVYNLTRFDDNVVPPIKTELTGSVHFRGDSTLVYKTTGINARRMFFAPMNAGENKDFTVEGWFRFDDFDTDLNENGGVIFTGSKSTEVTPRPSIEGGVYHTPGDTVGNKVAKVFFKCTAGLNFGSLQEYITTPIIEPNEWVHIAWVKDQDKLLIYINGELHQSFNFIGLNIADKGTINGMQLGTGTAAYVQNNPGMGFKGNVVDFRIVNGQAITICPDIFPLSLCLTGQPVDEDDKVSNEYVHLDSCNGIDTGTKVWTDVSGDNPFTYVNPAGVVVHNGPNDCPCYTELKTTLRGPKTSTFRSINKFSFASWFQTTQSIQDGSNERNLMDYTSVVGSGKYGFKVSFSSKEGGNKGTLDLVVGTGLTGEWKVYSTLKDNWTDDKWYNVIIIHSGTMVTMYINGEFHRGHAQDIATINSHTEDVIIGNGAWGNSLNLSNLYFYKNKELNVDEIDDIYNPDPIPPAVESCFPPKRQPADVTCDELKFHLSEHEKDPVSTNLTPITDSSKYVREIVSNNSTIVTPTGPPIFSLQNLNIDFHDDFRIHDTDDFCVDGITIIDPGATVPYYLVKKIEGDYEVTALTSTYNGHDWYIYIDPANEYLEFVRGQSRCRVSVPTNEFFHFACVYTKRLKAVYINGNEPTPEVFDSVPSHLAQPVISMEGTVDDLRIIKGNPVYTNMYNVPTTHTDVACRDQSPISACIRVTDDEDFRNWVTPTAGQFVADKRYGRYIAQLTTNSGPTDYVELRRDDTVAFDYSLEAATSLRLTADIKMRRLDQSDGSDVYMVISQDSGNHRYYYHVGHTGNQSTLTRKIFEIDLTDNFDWTVTSHEEHPNGNPIAIDLTDGAETTLGFAISNTGAGTVVAEFHSVSLEVLGRRCSALITPDNPPCTDILYHISSPEVGSPIIDQSPNQITTTYDRAASQNQQKKHGTTSIEFSPLSAYIVAENSGEFSFDEEPFTVEFWSYLDTLQDTQHFFSQSDGSNGDKFRSYVTQTELVFNIGDNTISIPNTHASFPTINTWHHYALVGDGDDVMVFVDGELVVEADYQPFKLPGDFYIGAATKNDTVDPLSGHAGYMDDFRIALGTTVYNTKFLPPAFKIPVSLSEFTVPSCDSVRLHLQSINYPEGNDIVSDFSGKDNLINVFNVKHTAEPVLNTSSSFYFDSNSSVLVNGSTDTMFDVLSGQDFSIEARVKPSLTGRTASLPGNHLGYGIVTSISSNTSDGSLLFLTQNGHVGFYARDGSSSILTVSENPVVEADKWYHIAVTREIADTTLVDDSIITVYVDGKAIAGGNYDNAIIPPNGVVVGSAYAATTTVGGMIGHMNDVRITSNGNVPPYVGCGTTIPDTLHTRCSTLVTPQQPECDQVLGHIQAGALGITDEVIDLSKHNHTISNTEFEHDIKSVSDAWYVEFISNRQPLFSPVVHDHDHLGHSFTLEFAFASPSAVQGDNPIISTGDGLGANTGFVLSIKNQKVVFEANGVTIESPELNLIDYFMKRMHVALTRFGTGQDQTILYVNGIPVATGTVPGDVKIRNITDLPEVGNSTPGYTIGGKWTTAAIWSGLDVTQLFLSDIRVTAGHSVYMGNFAVTETLPTLRRTVEQPLLADIKFFLLSEGNVGSSVFSDISRSGHSVISDNDVVKHSDDDKKWGSTSVKFDGGVLMLPRLNNVEEDFINIGSGDFAYEMWVKPTAVDVLQTLLSLDKKQSLDSNAAAYGHDAIRIDITDTNAIRCQIRSKRSGNPRESDGTNSGIGAIKSFDNVIKNNTWHHIVWSRENGIFRIYVDGANVSTPQSETSTRKARIWDYPPMRKDSEGNELSVVIGGTRHDQPFSGYIDGLRYTKGNAIYTECSYVVPTDKSPLDRGIPKIPDCEDVIAHIQADSLYKIADFSGNEHEVNPNPVGGTTEMEETDAASVLNGTHSIPISCKSNGIIITNDDPTKLNTISTSITYEMWIKTAAFAPNNPNHSHAYRELSLIFRTIGTGAGGLSIFASHNKILVWARYYVGFGAKSFTRSFDVPVDTWSHIAVVRENHTFKFYIDGELLDMFTIFGGRFPHTTAMSIGNTQPSPAGNDAVVYVDDIRVSKDLIFTGNSNIYTQRLPRCESSPGGCEDLPDGYDKLKVCMSFESSTIDDMSRYSHTVSSVSGADGIVSDPNYQTYMDDGVQKQFHSGFHGQVYHDMAVSNGLTVTASDHLLFGNQDFAVELHIPPQLFLSPNNVATLYEHTGQDGDGVTIYFESDAASNVVLCAELVGQGNTVILKSHIPNGSPHYDFGDATRGAANQRIMVSRDNDVIRLYGYHNSNENQASVLASEPFAHSINNTGDVRIGHGWSLPLDSIRITVGGIIGNCPYFDKKTCIKCEGFTGDVDAVRYICAVARSIGIQPVDIPYDKLYEINKFVVDGKTQGWWSKIYALYLPIWGDLLANAINVVSPGTYNLDEDWTFNNNSGTWDHDDGPYVQLKEYTTGESGNGIITPFTNSELVWTHDSCSMGVYIRNLPLDHNTFVMSADNNTGITVNSLSECNPYKGFILKTSLSQEVNTYSNGTIIDTQTGSLTGISDNNPWVVGGTNWAGAGNMTSGINDIELQGIYFGGGLDHSEAKSLSTSMVKVIQTFDYDDKNPSDIVDEDYHINKALFAALYRLGYTYTNPSWIRERDAMPGLTPDAILHHDLYQPIKDYYTAGISGQWSEKIKALYLPMWKDSNVNRINFACPWLYDIGEWNVELPFWRLGGGNLTNPPSVGGNAILPTPYAYYNPDDILANDKDVITKWEDSTVNGIDLVSDTSDHDGLSSEPTGPQLTLTGGLNRDEKCVLFGYNGSRTPGAEHLYEANRKGNAFRLVANNGIPESSTSYKHVFIVYRSITAIDGSSPFSLNTTNGTAPGIIHHDSSDGESITQSGFGSATINGYRGSYWKNDTNGDLTWTPDPKTIWPDGSNSTPAGTPLLAETRFGKRIIHYQPISDDTPDNVVFCLGNLNSADPVAIHGEYYDVVVYNTDLTPEQILAVYNYLGSKHDITLHDDLLHNTYSSSVTHGHGPYAYIPSNDSLAPGSKTQGTLTTFLGDSTTNAYNSKYISITNSSGGFGSVKYSRDYCGSSALMESSMGNLIQSGWALGSSTNSFSILNGGLGVNPGFAYIAHEPTVNSLYTIDFNTPSDSYNRITTDIPITPPAIFSLSDNGTMREGSQDKYQAFFFTDDLTTSNQLSGFGDAVVDITNSIDSSVGVTCNNTYVTDPDAQSYICAVINAGGLLESEASNDPRSGAINQFIIRGKQEGWYNKVKALYLPIWQCSAANKINVITPGVKSLILDNTKLDHESGKYLRLLGTGTDDENSSEIILPYKPRDILRASCEEHNPRDLCQYTHNITANFKNFNINTGTNPLLWGFMYNELNNSTSNQKTYANDPYNPDVSRDDLLMTEWPSRADRFTVGPINQKFNGSMNELIHDRSGIGGGLVSENIIGCSHSDIDFHELESRSTTTTGLSGMKDTGGTGLRDYVIPQYYLNMPLGGSIDTSVNYIALGTGFNVDTDQVLFNDYKEAIKVLLSSLDNSLNSFSYPTIGSNDLKLHGATSRGESGALVTLSSVKMQASAYDITIPESKSTISTPFTGVWDDDRSWNYKLHDINLEIADPTYTGNIGTLGIAGNHNYIKPNPYNNSFPVNGNNLPNATAFGYAIRRPCGGLGVRETLRGNSYYYNEVGNQEWRDAESQTYIRGLTSGAVRRSTWGHASNPYNDNPGSGQHEDRMLKLKIKHDEPHKGVFVGGGSSRTHDTTTTGTSETAVQDSTYRYDNAIDTFNLYPSNNIQFQVGESLEIMYIDGSYNSADQGCHLPTPGVWDYTYMWETGRDTVTCLPLRSNIEYYNGRYKVAELADLDQQFLTDGDVFTQGDTHGGPEPKSDLGASAPLRAWMRIEMEDITTIDIGPTNEYDLVLTSVLSGTDVTKSHEWTTRFYFNDKGDFTYNLSTDLESNICVSGTYSDYAVVNYDPETREDYSINLSCQGKSQTTTTPNISGYTQAFAMKVNPDNGEVISFRSTGGECKSVCLGSATDSRGNIYMVGSIAGNVEFIDDHGKFRSVDRGVNTGSLTSKYGFIAKSSLDETELDRYAKYRPLDYTWEWVNYIDAPSPVEGQDRVVSDIVIDDYDDIYVVGYYNSPSEIGRSGAKSHTSDTLQFEQGYMWSDTNAETVFVSKYDTTGRCKWSKTTPINSRISDVQKIRLYGNEVVIMNNANGVEFGSTSLSGVCFDAFDTVTGDYSYSKDISTSGTIECNDFNIVDSGIISAVGDFTGSFSSNTITLLDKPTSQTNSTGFFALLPARMITGRIGSFSTAAGSAACGGTALDYSIGHNAILGISDGDISASLGMSAPITQSKPTDFNKYIFTISHEL
ncbi:hypothetical protein CMK18_20540, partial [Candidatus Poribacteria bacterium]|nr:hypothetical protein [Candidatus Poribacteria bacterium]